MTRVTEIAVSSGRTLPHPTTNYATMRADITIRFSVEEGEDKNVVIQEMQDRADLLTLKQISRMIDKARARSEA